MKLFVRFLASATTAIVLCGLPTSSGADFSSSKVVVIVKATTSEFWQTAFMGARAASKELGPHADTPLRHSHGLRKISSETGSLTLAPGGTPPTLTRLFSANGLITMSGLDVGIA